MSFGTPSCQQKLYIAQAGDSRVVAETRQAAISQLAQERYQEIFAHEAAHASRAGKFGGAIHIDYDQNGVAFGGHVPITTPQLNPLNPQETYADALQVADAAVAPGTHLSAADLNVNKAMLALADKAAELMRRMERAVSSLIRRGEPPTPEAAQQLITGKKPAGQNAWMA
jgi:hypothetical protein